MDTDLKRVIEESLNDTFKNGLPISGEEKYSKQEPGGIMGTSNVDGIMQEIQSIDEDAFRIYNEKLCPALWTEDMQLDPEVRAGLLKVAEDFYEKTGLKAPILDVYLMGSIANFNWTDESDADVHVIINFDQLGIPKETVPEVIKTAGANWNNEHEVTAKGHKVELNIQDVKEQKPHVTGIYSLKQNAWIRKPVYQNIQVNKMLVQAKYKAMKKYVDAVINSGDRDAMKQAKKYIDAFRQYGLDTAGEMSVENIIFKALRAKGLLTQLKDSIVQAYDKEMTVREVNQKDMRARHPQAPTYVSHIEIPWNKLTLDNLKALKDKISRTYAYYKVKKNRENMTPQDTQYLRDELEFLNKINREIERRLNKINKPVAIDNPNEPFEEGYGAGIPETDRLNIHNNDGSIKRWQIRSKDAPKTPKMNEDVDPSLYNIKPENPLHTWFKAISQGLEKRSRIDLFPEEDIPPQYKKVLDVADRVLLKKSKDGVKYFELEYVENLLGDIIASEVPELPLNSQLYFQVKQALIIFLAGDYDIRYKGNRLK